MEFIEQLVNQTPYIWWMDGESTTSKEAPFYCNTLPPIEKIKQQGLCCAGLINLAQNYRGGSVPGVATNDYYAGGTYAWAEHLESKNSLERINLEKTYSKGSLLLRKYRSPEDQGHLAILYTSGVLANQQIIHCYPDGGVKVEPFQQSHRWLKEGYYEYICDDWLNDPKHL